MKTKDLTEFRYNLLDWKRLARNLVFWCPRIEAFLLLWRQNQSRKLDPQIVQIPQIPSCCALSAARRLLTTTFDQSSVGRLVVHIEENAGIGDFHELRRVAVLTDDRVGGIFGRERQ